MPSHFSKSERCCSKKRYCDDLLFRRFKTATIIRAPNAQSGIVGGRPGPLLGHCRSAPCSSGLAICTNSTNDARLKARHPILGTLRQGYCSVTNQNNKPRRVLCLDQPNSRTASIRL